MFFSLFSPIDALFYLSFHEEQFVNVSIRFSFVHAEPGIGIVEQRPHVIGEVVEVQRIRQVEIHRIHGSFFAEFNSECGASLLELVREVLCESSAVGEPYRPVRGNACMPAGLVPVKYRDVAHRTAVVELKQSSLLVPGFRFTELPNLLRSQSSAFGVSSQRVFVDSSVSLC